MPNGVDKNYRRLLMTCAVYRQKYGEWPSHARFQAGYLHSIAHLFDHENFERLAAHLELRTQDAPPISVGGRAVVGYDEVDHDRLDDNVLQLAERWLHLEIRRDIGH